MPASRPWFRFYVEMPHDLKIKRLNHAQRWLWCIVLCTAANSSQPGRLLVHDDEPATVADLAHMADLKAQDTSRGLQLMVKLGMVHQDGVVYVVTNWDSRQFESDTSTERTRRYRNRHRDGAGDDMRDRHCDVTSDQVVTSLERHRERHSDGPETEADTETDKKKTSSSSGRTRGARLTEEWTPTKLDVDWQRAEGITDLIAKRELPKFIDYWMSQAGERGVKLDWSRTWKNWLRTVQERTAQASTKTTPADRIAAENAWMSA